MSHPSHKPLLPGVPSSKVFLTSDFHFGHARIIELAHRPFPTVEAMNEALIDRFNAIVPPDGVTYCLGDFSLGSLPSSLYRRRLNGVIHLIPGNHSKKSLAEPDLWASISPQMEISVDGQHVTLNHYAMRIWNGSHRGSLHAYGHSHGGLPDDPNALSCDVGVDCWDYAPVPFARFVERMKEKTWKAIDHHGARPGEHQE